jgi:3-hydroxy acid dehydrogenase / malonic semialdehyde reductase
MKADTRKILVTGASRGIGRAIALSCLDRGDRVLGVSRTVDPECDAHEAFQWLEADLADVQSLDVFTNKVAKTFPDLDAIICNAGVGDFGSLEEFSNSQIVNSVHMNLLSHMLIVRGLLPVLKNNGKGDIIFIGSESALRGGKRGSLYAAAKFGLRGFAQAIRQEAQGRGIKVAMIHPGMVKTNFFDGLDFGPGPDESNRVNMDEICRATSLILDAAPSTVFDEIMINPLKKVIVKKK